MLLSVIKIYAIQSALILVQSEARESSFPGEFCSSNQFIIPYYIPVFSLGAWSVHMVSQSNIIHIKHHLDVLRTVQSSLRPVLLAIS